jgi:hypothetical protein
MMLANAFALVITVLVALASFMFYQRRNLRRQFKTKYGAEPKEAVERVMLPMSDRMIEEGVDWSSVEYAMRDVMSDLSMLQGEQAKVLSIIHGAWLRGQSFIKKYGRSKAEARTGVLDYLEQIAHNAPDSANACGSAREMLTDLGGYSETQMTGILTEVNEWWTSWHRLFDYDSVLQRVKDVRSNIPARDDAPHSHAVLDDIEQAALDYPQGVPEAILKDAVLRLDEIATKRGQ